MTKLNDLGEITIQEMGSLPVYTPRFKGRTLKNRDDKVCKKTGGDCLKFVQKFLDMFWI